MSLLGFIKGAADLYQNVQGTVERQYDKNLASVKRNWSKVPTWKLQRKHQMLESQGKDMNAVALIEEILDERGESYNP
ncbi:hypothetical protein DA798_07500 [Lactobacillus sp. PFC-70]|nr:hypothetical protein DA798_07500 [Lactobacillus sp. PFC-70]